MLDANLRQATNADSEFAYQTKKAAFRTYVAAAGGWDEAEQRQLHRRRFAEQEFQVVQVSGEDVGVLVVARGLDCMKVNQLFILPEHQGRGIGEAIMKRVIEDAEGHGLPIRLRVLKANPRAAAFYRKLGFAETRKTGTHAVMERLPDQA
ncbi:MAG: GNAT family N-acetyltransferase [Victivallales bacterium]|nr:GNAT family N-acetyltransferase [Victivallales bacterium]